MDLIESFEQALENAEAFKQLRKHFEVPALKNFSQFSHWYYFPSIEAFAPSKFVGYQNTTLETYEGKETGDGGQTQNALNSKFNKLEIHTGEYNSLLDKLELFAASVGKNLSKKVTNGGGGIYIPKLEYLELSPKSFVVITENDESQWSDDTGVLYHFPKRYLKFLSPGTKAIYYKGTLKHKTYQDKRLSSKPHYFGIATIGKSHLDPNSKKQDQFAIIENYREFESPVIAKQDNDFLESIPESRKVNYWRDGVRQIDKSTYDKIVNDTITKKPSKGIDSNDDTTPNFESALEGKKKTVYTTRYERDPALRKQALAIHGHSCMACSFNFEEVYGEFGKSYIHVHHVVPLHETAGETLVDPETDLIPLCPNCHAMVHRKKNETLSLNDLHKLLRR